MRLAKVLLILAFFLNIFSANAQITRSNQTEIYFGLGLPMQPEVFKDYYNTGLSLNIQHVIFLSPRIGIPIFAGYEIFTVNTDAIASDFRDFLVGETFYDDFGNPYIITDATLNASGSASMLKVGAGLRPYITPPTSSLQIFLFGNVSYNMLKTTYQDNGGTITYEDAFGTVYEETYPGGEPLTDKENRFGAAAGAGIELPLGESFNLIFQGLYHVVFTEEENTTFIGLTAGLIF